MARKIWETEEVTNEEKLVSLKQLIPLYGLNKAALDEYKKTCDAENTQIKALMEECNIDSLTVDGYKCTYSVQKRTSMDEDKLLEFLKKAWTSKNGSMECPYIKRKEYVDMEVLENAIYKGEISNELLAEMKKCENVKKVETLRITKAKKKEEKE